MGSTARGLNEHTISVWPDWRRLSPGDDEQPWLVQDNRKALKNEFPCARRPMCWIRLPSILDDMHNPPAKLDQDNDPVEVTVAVTLQASLCDLEHEVNILDLRRAVSEAVANAVHHHEEAGFDHCPRRHSVARSGGSPSLERRIGGRIVKKIFYVSFTFGASIPVEAESEEEAEELVEEMETKKLMDLAADGFEIQGVEEEQHMATINVPVQFTGVVTVQVPDRLSPADAKLLATKLALARILATIDNPDAPEDDAYEDYADECSALAWKTAEADWDRCEVRGQRSVDNNCRKTNIMNSIDTGSGTVDYETIRQGDEW